MRELLNKYERVVEDDACHGGSILDVHGYHSDNFENFKDTDQISFPEHLLSVSEFS